MDTYYNQEINLDSYNQTQEYQLSSSLEENQNIYEEKDLLNNGNFENNTTELESLKNLNSYDEPNNYQVNEPFIETTNTSSSVMLGDKETIANTPNIDNGYNQSSSSFLDIGNSSNAYNINTLGGNQTLESTNTDSYNKILPIKYLKPVTIPSENYLHIPPSSDYNLDSNNIPTSTTNDYNVNNLGTEDTNYIYNQNSVSSPIINTDVPLNQYGENKVLEETIDINNYSNNNYSNYESNSGNIDNLLKSIKTENLQSHPEFNNTKVTNITLPPEVILPKTEVEYIPVKKTRYLKRQKTKVFVPVKKKVIIPTIKKIFVRKSLTPTRDMINLPSRTLYSNNYISSTPNISTQTVNSPLRYGTSSVQVVSPQGNNIPSLTVSSPLRYNTATIRANSPTSYNINSLGVTPQYRIPSVRTTPLRYNVTSIPATSPVRYNVTSIPVTSSPIYNVTSIPVSSPPRYNANSIEVPISPRYSTSSYTNQLSPLSPSRGIEIYRSITPLRKSYRLNQYYKPKKFRNNMKKHKKKYYYTKLISKKK